MPSGIGELLRPRQEAANLLSDALHGGGEACLTYVPLLPPKLRESPGASQDPARKRAADAEKARQRRNGVKTSFLNTGQLAPSYLRYVGAISESLQLCSRIWPIY